MSTCAYLLFEWADTMQVKPLPGKPRKEPSLTTALAMMTVAALTFLDDA